MGVTGPEPPAAGVQQPAPSIPTPTPCLKHPGQAATEKCRVCGKPICPRCMELFGYVCSPLCRGKAEARGIQVPAYAGQRTTADARMWRKVALVGGSVGTVLLLVLGFWFWYAWIGGQPRVVYSMTFSQPAYSGASAMSGNDQLIFLHGSTLARGDLKQKKQIWSRELMDEKDIDAEVARTMKASRAAIDKATGTNPDLDLKMPDAAKLKRTLTKEAAAALVLRVQGHNIWVASPGKVTRYDWDTGNVVKDIPLERESGGVVPCGNELLAMEMEPGMEAVTHINLNTCEARTEEFGPPTAALTNAAELARAGGPRPVPRAGLPIGMPGKDAGRVMDPAKVAAQSQHLSLAGSIALPAILANARNQERIMKEADGQPDQRAPRGEAPLPRQQLVLVPSKEGIMQVSVRMVEERIVAHEAMKPPPAKSALDGNLTVSGTQDLSNEMLNDMQRERGGEVTREDESRYAVTLRRADAPESWSGEVIGHPTLIPLKTVNVLTAGKELIVLDKSNKKLWQATLTFKVPERASAVDEDASTCGQGPCVEYKDTLFVFDQGVLTAFDLATGNARWRLPSPGIAGLFFDGQGMMYVNVTSADLESLKYSNQIDVRRKDVNVVMKLDPRTGKTLWRAEPGGLVNYVSGKFIYSVYKYQTDDEDEGVGGYTADSIMARHDTITIKRLNPSNGHIIWEHAQDQCPRDIRFDKNTIRMVFKKEVQVLRFFSF